MAERARPTFIIGGAPRAGTNFLCHALDRHPDVYVAKPYMPEPKVFMGAEQPRPEYARRYAALFAAAGARTALGEKTSYYLENEAACTLIRRHLPDVHMLFVVREPVARAYSNYLWTKKNGLESLAFEEAVRLEGRRPSPLPPLPAESSYNQPGTPGGDDAPGSRSLARIGAACVPQGKRQSPWSPGRRRASVERSRCGWHSAGWRWPSTTRAPKRKRRRRSRK